MTYLLDRNNKRKIIRRYIVGALLLLIITLCWPFVRRTTYTSFEGAVMTYGEMSFSFSLLPEFIRGYMVTHKTLVEEKAVLKENNDALTNEVIRLRDELKKEQEYKETASSSGSSALLTQTLYPLMQDVTTLYGTLLLSRGFKDGIEVGDIVYEKGYRATCHIEEVYTKSSRCRVLTSYGHTIEGVTSSSSLTLYLEGRGGHFVALVPRDTSLVTGETVYLRSNPLYRVGEVSRVSSNNQDVSWYVVVTPYYNPVSSSYFYVSKEE